MFLLQTEKQTHVGTLNHWRQWEGMQRTQTAQCCMLIKVELWHVVPWLMLLR